MAWVATAVVGGAVVGGLAQGYASNKAAGAQSAASQAGIAEQQRRFDAVQKLLAPYVQAGTGAVGGQQALLGLKGPQAEQQAISGIEAGPQYQSAIQQGEEGILQNAAATGGLRGGNVQEALMRFRPQLLSQLIQQRFQNLGSVAQLGQASAAGQASAGLSTGQNIADLLSQQGQAQAGGYLAQGQAFGNVGNSISNLATLKALKVF